MLPNHLHQQTIAVYSLVNMSDPQCLPHLFQGCFWHAGNKERHPDDLILHYRCKDIGLKVLVSQSNGKDNF